MEKSISKVTRGRWYEDLVLEFLLKDQYILVDRRFYMKNVGEIDLIFTKSKKIYFIEVRNSLLYYDAPHQIVKTQKLKKIYRTSQYFLRNFEYKKYVSYTKKYLFVSVIPISKIPNTDFKYGYNFIYKKNLLKFYTINF